ncbi:hypothetical protein WICMUC_004856 [Wickerhamomyces mucosus]|uniref:Uncharacterized protein n=1 Tax=Wickerhamomyces mucosus TaxID=1378264 RepID=A0A9P8PF14_9ASCO|nr:hypothetical protein WICMUC_004856 [Wickerhamomyces mucosus]
MVPPVNKANITAVKTPLPALSLLVMFKSSPLKVLESLEEEIPALASPVDEPPASSVYGAGLSLINKF